MPIGNTISKKQVIVPAFAAALVLMMTPTMAFAQNAHFVGEPSCEVISSGALKCSGKIAGLGNTEEVTAFLQADVTATFACDNPGPGVHIPPGQPTDSHPIQGDQTTLPVRNGQTTFTLTTDAPQPSGDFSCPNDRWKVVLQDVEYTNVAVVVDGEELEIPGTFSN